MPEMLISQPRILILDAPNAPAAIEGEWFADHGLDAQIIDSRTLAPRDLAPAIAAADIILTWHSDVDAALLSQARRCLMVLYYGPGIGPGVGRVDMEAARHLGIYVSSVPNYAAEVWADETLRLMRELTAESPDQAARPLKSLRLGLVGMGAVGRLVARQARELHMEVWACDPFVGPDPFDQVDVHRAGLEDLFGIADIVSLHVPLGPATHGLVGADSLRLLKDRSLLINTAAPELIDLEALATALGRRRPLAAAFDADLTPLLPPGHPLLTQPGLRHGACRASRDERCASACRRQVARMIVHMLEGNRPAHLLIDPPCPRHILLLAGLGWD